MNRAFLNLNDNLLYHQLNIYSNKKIILILIFFFSRKLSNHLKAKRDKYNLTRNKSSFRFLKKHLFQRSHRNTRTVSLSILKALFHPTQKYQNSFHYSQKLQFAFIWKVPLNKEFGPAFQIQQKKNSSD